MPFRSYKQESYFKHNLPGLYRKWKKKYGIKPVKRVPKIKRIGGK
jgi:hypothetical protein